MRLVYPTIDLLNVASEKVAGTVTCSTDTASKYPVIATTPQTDTGRLHCLSNVLHAAPKPVQALY